MEWEKGKRVECEVCDSRKVASLMGAIRKGREPKTELGLQE